MMVFKSALKSSLISDLIIVAETTVENFNYHLALHRFLQTAFYVGCAEKRSEYDKSGRREARKTATARANCTLVEFPGAE